MQRYSLFTHYLLSQSGPVSRNLNSRDASDHDTLLSSLSASLSAHDLTRFLVSAECVEDTFAHLKRGKSDGSAVLYDHFIHALSAIGGFITMLFTAILRHGYMPEPIRNCILVPIPKANKHPAISDNYRPICGLSSQQSSRVMHLLLYPDHFMTSGLQFGFREKMSTTLKAFDLVNHSTFFNRLIERNFSTLLTRFLLFWYQKQRM